jgi:large subunit ribosomal protein L30
MGSIKITQIKSAIDRPKRQKDTLKALGIKKLHNPVVKTVNPQIMGMVAKVAHLITVQDC